MTHPNPTSIATTSGPYVPSTAVKAHSSLVDNTKDGRKIVETSFSCEDFEALKTWWQGHRHQLGKAGAFVRRFSGKVFTAVDRSTSGLYSDVRYYVKVGYKVDQEAAETLSLQLRAGSYAGRSGSDRLRTELLKLAMAGRIREMTAA